MVIPSETQIIHCIFRVMGNGQAWDKPNGFHKRRQEDLKEYAHRNDVKVPECVRWSANMKDQVDKLFSWGVTHVHYVGHSHGFGRGFPAFLKALKKRNKAERKWWKTHGKDALGMEKPRQIVVVNAIGNDAVKYPKFLGFIPIKPGKLTKPLLVRSLCAFSKIKLPKGCALNLYGTRQDNRIPKGHRIFEGKREIKVELHNTDEDGVTLVHHDARPDMGERDFDESIVSRNQELTAFKQSIG